MPQVPNDGLPTVAPSPPNPYIKQNIDVSPDDFGASVDQAMGQVGQATEGSGFSFMQQQGELLNEAAAKDTYNQFSSDVRTTLFDPKDGFYAKQGKDAVDAYQPTMDHLQDLQQQYLDNMPNQKQRNLFQDVATRRINTELDSMASHADQQQKVFQTQASKGVINNAISDGATYWNDDKRFNTALGTIQAETSDEALRNGMPGDAEKAMLTENTSKAWSSRLTAMSSTDPVKALDYYNANMDQISGEDQPRLYKELKTAAMPYIAKNGAALIMSGHSTGNFATLQDAVIDQESGGQTGLLSGKGAAGLMQLMPGTAQDVAKEMGIAYDPDRLLNDADYNKQLGTRYLSDMMGRYGGNQTLALAAYNAGPGNVDQWIAKNGDPRQGQISNDAWAAKIPFPETQNYVTSINAKVPAQAGMVPTNDDPKAHEASWIAQAENFSKDPVVNDQVEAQVRSHIAMVEQGNRATDIANKQTVLNALSPTDPTATPVHDMDQLMADPNLKKAFLSLDPADQVAISKRVSEGPLPSDKSEKLYYSLQGMATNPDTAVQFRNMNLMDDSILGTLPRAQVNELVNMQGRLNSQDAKFEQRQQNMRQVMEMAKPSLIAAGIHIPTPKDAETDEGQAAAQNYMQFQGRLDKQIQQFQDENKRSAKPDEVQGMVKNLLVQGFQANSGGWLHGDQKEYAFQDTGDPNNYFYVGDPPKTDQQQIISSYQAKHGVVPSQDTIRQIYTAATLAKQK